MFLHSSIPQKQARPIQLFIHSSIPSSTYSSYIRLAHLSGSGPQVSDVNLSIRFSYVVNAGHVHLCSMLLSNLLYFSVVVVAGLCRGKSLYLLRFGCGDDWRGGGGGGEKGGGGGDRGRENIVDEIRKAMREREVEEEEEKEERVRKRGDILFELRFIR